MLDADSEDLYPFEYKEDAVAFCNQRGKAALGYTWLAIAGRRIWAEQLNKLIDATQSWTADELIGSVVMVTDGTGKLEPQPWRLDDHRERDVTVDGD